MSKTIILLSLCVSIMSCAVKKSAIAVQNGPPQIIYMTYVIYNEDNKYSAILVDTLTRSGNMKGMEDESALNVAGNYLLRQLDHHSKELSRSYLSDVLSRSVEYADDKGQLLRRTFSLDSAYMTHRMDLNSLTEKITLSRIDKDLKTDVLVKTIVKK